LRFVGGRSAAPFALRVSRGGVGVVMVTPGLGESRKHAVHPTAPSKTNLVYS
jgi:hypothetical protein